MATAKLFMTGRSQAVRLPKEFRFEGTEVRIRRMGKGVLIEPVAADLQEVFRRIDTVGGEPFPERPPQPPMEERDYGFD
jgi:antitoxin VapB